MQSLERLQFRGGLFQPAKVIVVDNDPRSGTSNETCDSFANCRWEMKSVAEKRQGISYARNKALQEAFDWGADAIAFIDDDEVAEPNWLDELLAVQRSSGAEGVCGPVLSHFEEPPPAWMIKVRSSSIEPGI